MQTPDRERAKSRAPGAVRLVYGCLLRLEAGWEDCRPGLCRSRPCWVARWEGDNVWLLPFSRDLWRSPLVFRCGSGLVCDSAMLPKPVKLSVKHLGPSVAWLDPMLVRSTLDATKGEIANGLANGSDPGRKARGDWLSTIELITGATERKEAA